MRALMIPYTFVLMNWAAVAGLYHYARGDKNVWKDIWLRKPETV
jgi:hypothetical protein